MRLVNVLDPNIVPKEGSTIFMENLGPTFVERAIEKIGGGDMTHVAIVLYDKGRPMVYEANMPKVHKVSWREYISLINGWEKQRWTIKQGGVNPFYLEPVLDSYLLYKMRNYAESKLGIRYGLVFNYFWNNGRMHCSEFAGGCWNVTGLIKYLENRESPHSLLTKLLKLEI